eukprot:s158_g17.t1
MGKKANQPPWRGSRDYHDYSHGYSLWAGAWKASPKSKAKARPEKPTKPVFPAYDEEWSQAAGIAEVALTDGATSSRSAGSGLVHDVQAAVNLARRLDQKISKLRAEALKRTQSWNDYVVKVQKAYAKEKARAESDQRRIALDLRELEQQQVAAYYQVRHVATTSGPGAPQQQALSTVAWEAQLVEDAMDVTEEGDATLGAELARIMNATRPLLGPGGAELPAVVTPKRPPTTAPRTTPPGLGHTDLLRQDPYMTSPGLAHFGIGSGLATASALGTGQSRSLPTDMPESGFPATGTGLPAPDSGAFTGAVEIPKGECSAPHGPPSLSE